MSKSSLILLFVVIALCLASFGACYESYRVCEDCDVYTGKQSFLGFHYWGTLGEAFFLIAVILTATVIIIRTQRRKMQKADYSVKLNN